MSDLDWWMVATGSASAGGLIGHLAKSLLSGVARRRRAWTPIEAEQRRVSQILEDRCAAQAPAVLVVLATGVTLPCRLHQVTDGVLSVVIAVPAASEAGLAPHALLAVQFNVGGRARLFLAPVTNVARRDMDTLHVDLLVPNQLADGETRGAFRVAMVEHTPLQAIVCHSMNEATATVTDLSATGVGLRLSKGDALDLKEGDAVELRLYLDGRSVQRSGVVQRAKGGCCGISLSATSGDQASADETTYLDFVRRMIDLESGEDA